MAHRFQRSCGGGANGAQLAVHGVLDLLVRIEGGFQVPHHKILTGLIGGDDQLAQELEGKAGGLVFGILDDDLGESDAREILAGLGVDHLNVSAFSDQAGDVVEVDVAAGGGVIKAAVSVFSDDDWVRGHGLVLVLQATKYILTQPGAGATYRLDAALQQEMRKGMKDEAKTGASPGAFLPFPCSPSGSNREPTVFSPASGSLLDLVMRQNAMAMNALRERLATARPASALSEAAGEGMGHFIAAQKILLDLAQRENEIVLTGVKERVGASGTAAAMTDLLRRSVDTFIDLQRHFLDIAAKQSDAWVHAAKTGKAFSGEGLADLAKEGMERFAETQKKFLDVVAEETAKAAKGRAGWRRKRRPQLSELARQSVDAFIDAQKKLLDTAAAQAQGELESGREGRIFRRCPAPRFPI